MYFKLLNGNDTPYEEPVPTYVTYWWDRIYQSWVVQLLDQNKYEIENQYSGNKTSRDFIIDSYVSEYNIPKENVYKG